MRAFLKNQLGFTLIELLAVMAIVATLAGIVSVAVSGSGGTSRDTQTKQDATTVETAASDFFADQVEAEVLTPETVTVLDRGPFQQIKSSRWPEEYISVAYGEVFPPTTTSTVFSVTFITESGTISTITLQDLLTKFNAIDFNALIDGNFMAVEPDGATQLTENRYNNYLWLLEKTTASGGSSEGAARQVAVFKLVAVEKNEVDNFVDLTYLQLVGEVADTTALVDDILVDEDAADTVISLGAFFTSVAVTGNTNPTLIEETLTGTDLTLDYQPEQNGESTITLLGTLINDEPVQISFLVTVDPVNDTPLFNAISDPAPVLDIAGIQTVSVSGINTGPVIAGDEAEQTVGFTVSLLSETPAAGVITGLAFSRIDSANGTISYTPANPGQAVIQVVADDGQATNAALPRSFTVTVVAETIVVPNSFETTEASSFTSVPFNYQHTILTNSIRVQTRYPASQFAGLNGVPAYITRIAHRPNFGGAGNFGPVTISDVLITLATMPSSQVDLSLTLDDNIPNAALVVHNGDLILDTAFADATSGTTKKFDIVIDLQTPFLYDPSTGDLVVEVQIPPNSGAATNNFDAVGVVEVPPAISLISGGFNAVSVPDSHRQFNGLVT